MGVAKSLKTASQPLITKPTVPLKDLAYAMIRDHVAVSIPIEHDDLEMAPFDGQGGLGKMVALFGGRMDALLDELNEVLVARFSIARQIKWRDTAFVRHIDRFSCQKS